MYVYEMYKRLTYYCIFQISETVTLKNDVEQFLTHLLIVGCIFVYLFLANHAGQEVTDHNADVFSTA